MRELLEPVQSAGEPTLRLWGDYALASPWFLLLVPLALLLMGAAARGGAAVPSGGLPAGRVPRTLRQRLAFLPPTCRVLAVVLLAIALARPLRTDAEVTDTSEGVDVVLVVDRSSSMFARDMEGELGTGRTRSEVVREVALDFALRRTSDRGFARDAVGLMGFAGFPELICPLTLDSDALLGFADRLEVVRNGAEDGTRIGAALAKAVQVLAASDAKSRVVVLLSDGEESPDPVITPLEAAEYAASEGVRVYTILAGQRKVARRFGQLVLTNEELDEREMRAVAERANGTFYRARDRQQLEDIYAEIERLERTPRESVSLVAAFDLYPPFLLAGLVLYLVAWFARSTAFHRTLP